MAGQRYYVKGSAAPNPKIKAVNLGGWLVVEGWIKPSLFDRVTINKDLLDGTKVQFRSVTTGKYLCAEYGGGAAIVANRPIPSTWETFRLWRMTATSFQFRVLKGQFVGLSGWGGGTDVVSSTTPGIFEYVRSSTDQFRVRIKAPNGRFLQARTELSVTADSDGGGSWGDDDPSVFIMKIVWTLKGEYQLTNALGPDLSPSILRDHWNSFIVEADFKFMSESGLNTVRIPVGWWIAEDPNPPAPFVGGSLEALDNAFTWAERYNMKVIIDLHAVGRSQNGEEHSGTRDGTVDWGTTEESIQETVDVNDFLAARYANRPGLLAISLLNEPVAGIDRDQLQKFYKAGYNAVRRYTDTAYVIMSARRWPADEKEYIAFASSLMGTVLDVHFYNLFTDWFTRMSLQQHIDFINNDRKYELISLVNPNGPLIIVGEWTAEYGGRPEGVTEGCKSFASAQLDVYGDKATFGWAFWTYRMEPQGSPWSLEWMIKSGLISLH